MQIIFTKGNDGSHTLSYSMQDEPILLSPLFRGMIEHDILHYVVESVLQFDNGFFGLLAKGYQIEDFSPASSQREANQSPIELPQQIVQAEYIIGLLQMELADKKEYQDFIEIVKDICAGRRTPFPSALNEGSLNAIREKSKTLLSQWQSMQPDEAIAVNFSFS